MPNNSQTSSSFSYLFAESTISFLSPKKHQPSGQVGQALSPEAAIRRLEESMAGNSTVQHGCWWSRTWQDPRLVYCS